MSRKRRHGSGLFPGLVMMGLGAIFLLERFDLISMRNVWQLWPMFIIWMGLAQLISPRRGRRSVFWLLIGISLQISTLELFGLDFSESWPLVIIAVGASFVFDSILQRPPDRPARDMVVEVDASTEVSDEQ